MRSLLLGFCLFILPFTPERALAQSNVGGLSAYVDIGRIENADRASYGMGFLWVGSNGFGLEVARRKLDEHRLEFFSDPGDGSPILRATIEGDFLSDAVFATYSQPLASENVSLLWKLGVHRWEDELFDVSANDPAAGFDVGYHISNRWSVTTGAEFLEFGGERLWRVSVKLRVHFR